MSGERNKRGICALTVSPSAKLLRARVEGKVGK
jgi:hypothetical protein